MLNRGWPNVWVYNRYVTNALSYNIYDNYSHGLWKVCFVYTSYFLISPGYYSIYDGSIRFSFSENLNYYYHEYHDLINSFHDHVHKFGMISHSFQGMVQILLEETGDFSSKAHYFAQQ